MEKNNRQDVGETTFLCEKDGRAITFTLRQLEAMDSNPKYDEATGYGIYDGWKIIEYPKTPQELIAAQPTIDQFPKINSLADATTSTQPVTPLQPGVADLTSPEEGTPTPTPTETKTHSVEVMPATAPPVLVSEGQNLQDPATAPPVLVSEGQNLQDPATSQVETKEPPKQVNNDEKTNGSTKGSDGANSDVTSPGKSGDTKQGRTGNAKKN